MCLGSLPIYETMLIPTFIIIYHLLNVPLNVSKSLMNYGILMNKCILYYVITQDSVIVLHSERSKEYIGLTMFYFCMYMYIRFFR